MPCLKRDCVEQNSEKELQVIKSARSNNKFILKINAITLSIFLLTNYGIKPIKNNAKWNYSVIWLSTSKTVTKAVRQCWQIYDLNY